MSRLALSYVLPLRADDVDDELVRYVLDLAVHVEDVIVVDGSDPEVFDEHHRSWDGPVRHLRATVDVPNGKVANVCTGLLEARHEVVVVADDDVRWDRPLLEQALRRIEGAGIVRPQNRFVPAPWHARWDTGRSLIHRALGGDWPGTLVVRRALLPDGYAGDCMFENLEMVRTAVANGGREVVALDLVVPRRPPTTRKFVEQRVRQAYDELARPPYLLAELALAPAVLVGGRRAAAAIGLGAVALAGLGRRRAGGREVWPAAASLWAIPWTAERAVTAWLAMVARARGGVVFGGTRFVHAAHRHPRRRAGDDQAEAGSTSRTKASHSSRSGRHRARTRSWPMPSSST